MEERTTRIADKLILFSMLFVSLAIYLPPLYKTLSLIILALILIFTYASRRYDIRKEFKINKLILLPALMYLLHIVGVFYSLDKDSAIFDLEVKLPLIILPILFLFIPKKTLSNNLLHYSGLMVVLGFIITILYCFACGFYRSFTLDLPLIKQITYTRLTMSPLFHPSYLGMMAVVSMLIIYKSPLERLLKLSNKQSSLIKIIVFILNIIAIILLRSLSGYIILVLSFIWIVINMFFVEKKRIKSIIVLLLFAFSLVLMSNFPILNTKYKRGINELKNRKTMPANSGSVNVRYYIYTNSFDMLMQSPIIGQGTGDVKDFFVKYYKDNNSGFVNYFNAHNQFVQIAIALGIIGLIVLLLVFALPMLSFLKQGDWVSIMIFIAFGVSFLFESMLERQMGTFSFALLFCLLVGNIRQGSK